MKKILIFLLKFSLVGAILYYLISSERLNLERLILLQQSPWLLLLMLGTLICLVIPLTTLRWWLLLRAIGLDVPPRRAFLLTWIGNFFNSTLPGAVSGDVVKGYYIIKAQEAEGRTRAFMTLLIDRFVGLFGLIVIAFFALITNLSFFLQNPKLHSLMWLISGLFAGTIAFYGIAVWPFPQGRDPFVRLFEKLPATHFTTKIYSAFKSYQHCKPTLAATLGIAVTIHALVAFLFLQVAQLITQSEIGLGTQLFLMPIGLITTAIPLAPGGIGIGHVAFESLYELVGVAGGADIFNLFIVVQLSVYLLGGIPYFVYNQDYKVPQEDQIPS
jgi:uncharacterized protein (TIRG00374 family)